MFFWEAITAMVWRDMINWRCDNRYFYHQAISQKSLKFEQRRHVFLYHLSSMREAVRKLQVCATLSADLFARFYERIMKNCSCTSPRVVMWEIIKFTRPRNLRHLNQTTTLSFFPCSWLFRLFDISGNDDRINLY